MIICYHVAAMGVEESVAPATAMVEELVAVAAVGWRWWWGIVGGGSGGGGSGCGGCDYCLL